MAHDEVKAAQFFRLIPEDSRDAAPDHALGAHGEVEAVSPSTICTPATAVNPTRASARSRSILVPPGAL